MSGIEWFRSWHGAATDSKWLVIARRAGVEPGIVSAVFWALLDHASQSTPRGSVAGFDVETYSAWSGFTEEHIAAVVRELGGKGVIVEGRLAEWDKRQPQRERETDRAATADRVRKHRAAKRHVTPCNTTADQPTPPPTTPAPETPPEKESDSEKKETQEPREARAVVAAEPKPITFQTRVDTEFEETFWPAFPNKVGKPKARVSFFIARKRAELQAIMDGLARYIETKPPDRQWLNPTTFLNQERFNDEPASVSASREPAHNAQLRALAALASDPADDRERPQLPAPGVRDQRGRAFGDFDGD